VGAHANRAKFARILVNYGRFQAEHPEDVFQQIGTWVLIGMTGRWQRTLALWEWSNGWEGFSASIEAQMISPPSDLAHVYEGVDALRSGGECFVMTPATGCPTRSDLISAGVRGSLLSYERADVEPGSEEAYVAAVRSEWEPVAATHGYRLIGQYLAAKVDGVVFTAWACERDGHTSLARSSELAEWRRTRRQWTRHWQEELWISAPGSPTAGTEVASEF
jgi:hypothetical protein